MESLRVAAEIVLPLLLMMAVGYIIRLSGLMNEASVRQTNKAIFKIFLPLLIFKNVYSTTLDQSFDSELLFYALAGVGLQFLIALCIAFLTEKDNSRRGVMLQGMFRGNFVLFGIPVCTALFGQQAAGLASLLITVIIPLYNVLAVISLEMFNGGRMGFFRVLKGIVTNPLIIASLAGVLFLVFHITLPDVLYTTVSSLSDIATPLAFVILGASFGFRKVGGRLKDLAITLSVKLLFFPILFLSLAILLGFRGAPLAVLLTVFASPVAVSSFTMAQQMGGDDSLADQMVVFSSILSVFTLFLLIFLLNQLSFL